MEVLFRPFPVLFLAFTALSFTLSAQADNGLTRHEFYTSAKIPVADRAGVKALADSYGARAVSSEYFVDYVNGVFLAVKAGMRSPLEAGEKMAQFGEKLDALVSKLDPSVRGAVSFAVADAVVTLEEFRGDEYVKADQASWEVSKAPFVHEDDYLRYVKGFEEKKPPFTDHVWGGDTLAEGDLRDGISHNLFPLQYQNHDIKQIQYALAHPRASTIYMKLARGHNHLRFALISALFEGADRARYEHERKISKYVSEKLHLDHAAAMMFVARASKSELTRFVDEAGVRAAIDSEVKSATDWAPTASAQWGVTRNGLTLDQETDRFIESSAGYRQHRELANQSDSGSSNDFDDSTVINSRGGK